MSERCAALLPMRHDSERVPGKNYRLLGGVPLFHHVVRALLASDLIDEVVIDTDSDLIASDVADHFKSVRVVDRPVNLRSGDTPMNDVLLHTVSQVDADLYLQTHSTNPFVRSETFDRAVEAFHASRGGFDSLFSVTALRKRLWTKGLEPINHDPTVLLRTQDLQPVYEENSCFYIFTASSLRAHGNRIGANPGVIEVEPLEAFDIDVETDFQLAIAIHELREQRGGSFE